MINYNDVFFGVQCRMGSQRLPGKVLKKIAGKELVLHLRDNLVTAGFNQEHIYFLIPDRTIDDVLASFLDKHDIRYFRGSESNVLSRYIELSTQLGHGKSIVRLTADNPFIDYRVVRSTIDYHIERNAAFTSTRVVHHDQRVERFVPKGNSVDIFKTEFMGFSQEELNEFDKEHVIPHLYKLTTVNLVQSSDFDFEVKDSVSVDTMDDFLTLERKWNAS